jgi:hypothetical protein
LTTLDEAGTTGTAKQYFARVQWVYRAELTTSSGPWPAWAEAGFSSDAPSSHQRRRPPPPRGIGRVPPPPLR